MDTTRREFIRKGLTVGGSLLAFGGASEALAACGGGSSPSSPAALTGPVNWLSFGSYHIPTIMNGFRDKYRASVNAIDVEDDSTAFLKLKQGGGGTYDVGQVDGFWPQICYKNHLIEPLDMSQLASTQTLAPQFKKFKPWLTSDGRMMQFPNAWSVEPIVARKGVVPTFSSAWDLWDKKFRGRVIQMDRPEETIGAIAIWLGYPKPFDLTDDQLGEVKKRLMALKPNIKTFTASSGDFSKLLAAGEGDLGLATSVGVVLRIKTAGGGDFSLIVPKEGTVGWVDGNMLIAGAAHRAAALKWIDYYGSTDTQVAQALAVKYPSANEKAVQWLKDNGHEDWVSAMGMENWDVVDTMVELAPPSDDQKWLNVWNEFKAA